MRIRFHSYFYPPCVGGGEVILQHQAEELARRGHEVHVHTTNWVSFDGAERTAAGDTEENGVFVHRSRSGRIPWKNPLEKDTLTPAVLRDAFLPADLEVCVGFPSLHLDALRLATRVRPTPLVVQNYVTAQFLAEILAGEGGLNKRVRSAYWKGWVRRGLRRAGRVIADSPAAARALLERLGLDNVRLHIGMAVDPAEFAAVTPKDVAALRTRLGVGPDRLIVAPSRVSRQKGADLLVDAARPLLKAGWRLVIAGHATEVDYDAALTAQIAGHPRIVRTQLSRAEQVALISTADIVTLPSRGETVGGVVFEGMYAHALTIVSDAVEAARETYLRHDENGLLFPSEDVGALRAALARGMADELVPLRDAGQAMVASTYTWGASVDRLLRIYDEALHA